MSWLPGRRFWLIGGFTAVGVLAAAARPTTAPSEPASRPATEPSVIPSPEVDTLISQLSDSHWQVRNRAVEQLVQLGAAAEPRLLVARDRAPNVDLRTRTELAIDRIHESRHSGATYVTLHLKSVRAPDAIDALAREAGIRFDAAAAGVGDGAALVSIDVDHKPLWTVIRAICEQAKLEVASINGAGLITLRGGGDDDWGGRPASIQGPYMLVARRMELTRSLDFAKPKNVSNAYELVLLAYAEPKLRPIYWTVSGIEECLTESGRRLELAPNEGLDTGDLNSDTETRFAFTGPPDAGRKLAKLRLTARFVLSEKSQPLEISNVLRAKSQTRTVGGWRVTIKGVNKNDDDRYAAGVTVYRDNHTTDEWTERMGLLGRSQPRLIDADGLQSGGNALNEGPDEWTWTGFAPANAEGKPSKLQWDFPLETRHSEVTFEFKDLPLP